MSTSRAKELNITTEIANVWSPGNLVCKVTGEDRAIAVDFRQTQKVYLLSAMSRLALGPTQPPPTSAEVKIKRRYASNYPYASMA